MQLDPLPRIERLRLVLARTGLGRSTLYVGIAAGTFPRPVKISSGAVGFMGHEIDEWILARAAQRGERFTAALVARQADEAASDGGSDRRVRRRRPTSLPSARMTP